MVEKILVREMPGKSGKARPVELIMNTVEPVKFAHTDMQVSVCADYRGDTKLGEDDDEYPNNEHCD